MKRYPAWAISAITILVVAGAAISAAPADVRVIDVSGRVQTRVLDGTWKDAREGERLSEGAEVLTDSDGTCSLSFTADGTGRVLVKTGTHATIVSADPVRINLDAGGLLAYVKGLKKGSSFSVGTPVAVASVRGSGFGIDLAADRRQTSFAFDDTLKLEVAGGGTLELSEGKGVDLSNGEFGEPFDIPGDKQQEWVEFAAKAEDVTQEVSLSSEAEDIDRGFGGFDTNSETRDIKADDGLEIMDKPSGAY